MDARRVNANLSLSFRKDARRELTLLDVQRQQPPLRVVRAFELADGAALSHLHNLSGGVLGGDQLSLSIRVHERASAQVTSTGSTRIYRQRTGQPDATQQTSIDIEAGGLLEYLPDTLIPYAHSRYHQRTQISLGQDAGLFYWEIVTPGREGLGEVFQYEWLRLDLDICAENRPIAMERMQIEPALRPLQSLMRMGHFRYFSTFYICRVGLAAKDWLALESSLDAYARNANRLGEVLWGVSALSAHGLIIRGLATSSRTLQEGLIRFWQVAKRELYARDAIRPRKIY